jgi:hypothetical protein
VRETRPYIGELLSWPAEPADALDAEAGIVRRKSFGAGDASGLAGRTLVDLGRSTETPFGMAAATLPGAAVAAIPLMIAAPFIAQSQDDWWAYREPPTILLAPASFATKRECDEYFDELRSRVAQAAQVEIEHIDAECRPWPCVASEARCTHPMCERKRVAVEARMRAQLGRLDSLRTKVAVEAP